ncbi:hypothetical protein MKX01_042147 [Papaver californicum]|nr:hypothetical protein MKX01_042147 [Papaver californicum]
MQVSKIFFTVAILLVVVSVTNVQKAKSPPSPPLSPTPAPAPVPAPDYVNLTDLLTVAGPFHTFLNYLEQTKVIETFQNQANNTEEGLTIFVPKDKAFSSIKKPAFLSNLTADQLKYLILFHVLPHYYSLADFKNLSKSHHVTTFACGQYMLNFTDLGGTIYMSSGWSKTKASSVVHSTYPVAIYQVDNVLLPETLFGPPPSPTPSPLPSLDVAPAADAPETAKNADGFSPKSSKKSSSHKIVMSYFVFAVSSCLVLYKHYFVLFFICIVSF